MNIVSIEYDYHPASDWYVKYTKYKKGDEHYILKNYLEYYYGDSNVPKIGRKK
jgi:hypothetical protein